MTTPTRGKELEEALRYLLSECESYALKDTGAMAQARETLENDKVCGGCGKRISKEEFHYYGYSCEECEWQFVKDMDAGERK